MPKTPEQYQKEREEKKQLIKSVALELFSHESYLATSISKIAKKVGMSKGLFYNYFESKEELLEELLQDGFNKIAQIFTHNNFRLETKQDFEKMIDEIFKIMKDEPNFWRLYMSLALQPASDKYFNEHIMEVLEVYMSSMISYFTKKGCKNPQAEAITLGALMDGLSFGYSMQIEIYPLEEIKKIIIEKFA